MDGDWRHHRELRSRRIFFGAAIAIGTLTLGSCSGLMLGRYTVSGMNPFYASQSTSYLAETRLAEANQPADPAYGGYAATIDAESDRIATAAVDRAASYADADYRTDGY